MNYIENAFLRLRSYCEKESFKGWDPYDGLNSGFFKALPFKKNKFCRLLWIQLFKNSPVNLRSIFYVPKEYNPKGLALFLSGYASLAKNSHASDYLAIINNIVDILLQLRSPGCKHYCWGYNFDWQSRAFFIPRFTPNVIVSTFVGNALLDVYELTKNDKYLRISRSTCNFILEDLNKSYEQDGSFCFSYSALDDSRIFNASLLASKYLARVYSHTKDTVLVEEAKRSVEYCCSRQNADGSWYYGAEANQRWIDSFHTAYNLEALYEYQKYAGDKSYESIFKKGLDFYLTNFFTEKGEPKYYDRAIYPIDIHSTAQFIVLLAKTGLLEKYSALVKKVLNWTLKNMQAKKGYIYYQMKKNYTIKIPYMRWSCAWMFYALSYMQGKDGLWQEK